jgi:hypothetical protein
VRKLGCIVGKVLDLLATDTRVIDVLVTLQ